MIQLSSKERAFLRKLAHNLDPIVRIGKDGIDENVLNSIAEVVKKRELIKVKILQNSSVEFNREMGDEIANSTKSIFVDKIGNILIFSSLNIKRMQKLLLNLTSLEKVKLKNRKKIERKNK